MSIFPRSLDQELGRCIKCSQGHGSFGLQSPHSSTLIRYSPIRINPVKQSVCVYIPVFKMRHIGLASLVCCRVLYAPLRGDETEMATFVFSLLTLANYN